MQVLYDLSSQSRLSKRSTALCQPTNSQKMTQDVAIVLDVGSGAMKAGFGSNDAPAVTFPNVVGRPKGKNSMAGLGNKSVYYGEEALRMRGTLTLKYPIEHGIISNFDDFTGLMAHCLQNELRVDPTDRDFFLTEAPLNPKENREKIVEIFFETFSAGRVYIAIQAILSLYAAGRVTGLVLDSGDGVTHTVPVFEGMIQNHAVKRSNIAGSRLTVELANTLNAIGFNATTSSEMDIVKAIKEQHCYVAYDYEAEKQKYAANPVENETVYDMPDGSTITIREQKFEAMEFLYANDQEIPTAPEILIGSNKKCDIDIRKSINENLIMSGGTTCLQGMPERTEKDYVALLPAGAKVKSIATSERKYMVWIGGSIVSSLQSFNSWIPRDVYNESGPSIVHKLCQF